MSTRELEKVNMENRDGPTMVKSIKGAMALLCIAILGQSMMVTGALNASISTIERAFSYNSFQVAFLDTAYNIGFASCAFVLGYTISKNKIKWIGGGGFLISCGCLLFILPVFVKGSFLTLETNPALLCAISSHISRDNDICKTGKLLYLILMCIAYVFIGVGTAPLHTLAISYVEERTSHQNSGLFYGVYYAFAALGPVVAFVLFFFFSKVPIKPDQPPGQFLTPDNDNWIGAYWLIYVVGAVITFSTALPMLLFPSIAPITDSEQPEAENSRLNTGNFFKAFKKLFSNIPYIFICLGMFFDGILNNGIGVFMSKYIEAQFRIKPGKAGLLAGAILVLGAALGLFTGGYAIKRFNWSTKQLIRRITFFSLVGTITFMFLFIRCSPNNVNGVVQTTKAGITGFSDATCAAQCQCSLDEYFPVCVNDEDTFFSPCSLGCQAQNGTSENLQFWNCKCFSQNYLNSEVKKGKCYIECKLVNLFLVFGCIALIIEFLIYIPQVTLTMQLLDRKVKLFGVSFQQIFIRSSYVCGPLIYGPLLDMSCRMFKPTSGCQSTSNCIDYDSKYLSYLIAFPTIVLKLMATGFLAIGSYFVRNS